MGDCLEAVGLRPPAEPDLLEGERRDMRNLRRQPLRHVLDRRVVGNKRVRCGPLALGVDAADKVGRRDMGWRSQKYPVEHVCHDDGRADSEGQDADGRKRRAPVDEQSAGREANIPRERVYARQTPLLAVSLAHLLHATEGAPCSRSRILIGQAPSAFLLFQEFEVCGNLLAQLGVPTSPRDRGHQPAHPHTQPGHDSDSNSRLTISTVRSQLACSSANCFVPLLVMR